MKSRVSFDRSRSVSLPQRPKSTRPIRSGDEHEDVRRVRVAVEEAVTEDHRHPRVGDDVGEPAALLDRPLVEHEVGELHAVEVLHRQHARAGVAPVDARHRDVRVAGEVDVEGVARCAPPGGSRAPAGSSARTRRRSRACRGSRARGRARARAARPARAAGCRSRPAAARAAAAPSRRRGGRSAARRGAPGRSTRPPSAPRRTRGTAARSTARAPRWITRSTSAYGNGRTSSWSPRSSAMMSGGTMSGRVESSWPNLTNVGPSSSSISRRCRPRAVGPSGSTRAARGGPSIR